MTALISPKMISKVRYLRAKKRMSVGQIAAECGIAEVPVSLIVRDLPLTPDERAKIRLGKAAKARSSRAPKTSQRPP